MKKAKQNKRIILFDGYCLLCEWSVNFILKRDKLDSFLFASLQSETGKHFLKEHEMPNEYTESVILIEDSKLYIESDAALRIAKRLNGLWPVLYIFRICPRFFRNWIYRIISKNRFRWLKKKSTCYIPNQLDKNKFL